VVVNFTVDENGNVQDVRAVRSSHQEFEMPTIRAVSKWRFEPGRKDGKRVRFRMSVPVAFTLNEE
jgi:protein TonB